MRSVFVLFSMDENRDNIFFISSARHIKEYVAKFSVDVRYLKLQCDKHQDITDTVTWTIDTTSTATGDATTATAADYVVTSSQAAAATTNPRVSLCYLIPSALSVVQPYVGSGAVE